MRKLLIVLLLVLIPVSSYALKDAIKTTVVSVGTSATALPTTPLVGRKYITVQNIGSSFVYIGDSTVTADTASTGGFQLLPYASKTREYDHTVVLYGIATGTCKVVCEEGK